MNYTPLYVKTEYSLLQSLIKIRDLVDFAKEHNLHSLAITDDNMCGVMEFYKACKKEEIKPIIGLEVNLENIKIVLYAKNIDGYKNLLKIDIIENIKVEELKKLASNLICIVKKEDENKIDLSFFKDLFIGEENPNTDSIYFKEILCLNKDDNQYLKYLKAIREGLSIDQIKAIEYSNDLRLDVKDNNNQKIIDMCNVEIPFNEFLIPKYLCPKGYDSYTYLTYLCKEGLKSIFGSTVGQKYIDRLKYELEVIKQMNFCDYFLIVWDYVKYAKENNILVGPGRGSSAGSLVSYCLNIIEIDPLKYNLLFERFLNKERITMPDIDIDFDGDRKEEVINYCRQKYGTDKVANIITFSSLSSKQVIKDVGKIFNINQDQLDYFSGMFKAKLSLKNNYDTSEKIKNYLEQNPDIKKIYKICLKLENLKRHISEHASGVVISSKPLLDIVPILDYNNEKLTGYTMDYLEELGLIKMDFLSLKTLTTINEIIENIKDIDYKNIPLDDKLTFQLFSKGNTLGIFQFESQGMIDFLKKFKPYNFTDIYNIMALYRPGPMSNIDTFIERRNGHKFTYEIDALEKVLKSTYGIIVYQEQIMQIANIMASYTLGEADLLRRAMSKKKESILLEEKDKFISRSTFNGYQKEEAIKIYDLILKFAEYGFPKAHAVAYSVISYKMAYLKAHYPLNFMEVMLNRVIGSINDTNEYIIACKENGIEILNPDINDSGIHYEIKEDKIIYPLIGIKNVGFIASNHIILKRKEPYKNIFDFIKKVDKKIINKDVFKNLIYSGCFDKFLNRKTLIENLDVIFNYAEVAEGMDDLIDEPILTYYQEYSNKELLTYEYEVFGIYLNNHPVNEYRKKYNLLTSINGISSFINRKTKLIVKIDRIKDYNKKDSTMRFLLVSDDRSTCDAIIFNRNSFKNLQVGDIVSIFGRISRRNGKDQILVDDIKVLTMKNG